MKNLLILLCLVVVGCETSHTMYGETLTEPGIVQDLIYVPPGHGSGVSPGISLDGKIHFQLNNIDVPARYGIVFGCPHGTFAINDDGTLWKTLKESQKVIIYYREVFTVFKGDTTVVDLDFITAKLDKEQW